MNWKDRIPGIREESFEIGGIYPLSESEMHRLATYNSEVRRGIVHTEHHKQKMADLRFAAQARFIRTSGIQKGTA